jgi:hypothetical protein
VIWQLLLLIVGASMMFISSLLDYFWSDDKTTRKFHKARLALLVLSAVLVVISIIAVWTDHQSAEEDKAALRAQLEDLKAGQLGGKSYCYLFPTRPGKTSQMLDLMLMHEGEHPVFDVTVRVEDVNRVLETLRAAQAKHLLPYDSQTKADAAIAHAVASYSIGNVGPKQTVRFGALRMSGGDEEAYHASIMARNGPVFEQLYLRRVAGEWKLAYRVSRDTVVLLEHIDPDFPRKSKADPW